MDPGLRQDLRNSLHDGVLAHIFATLLLPISSSNMNPLTFLSLIFLSYAFASVSYVSWLSWMSDLVPDEIRGRFFGTRNMVCGAAGIAMMLQILRVVREPEEATVGQVFRILRSVRGLNITSGFNALLHPFVEIENAKARP